MLDDAEAGDSVEGFRCIIGGGYIAVLIGDRSKTLSIPEADIDAVQIRVPIKEKPRQDPRVDLGSGVKDFSARRCTRKDAIQSRKRVPILGTVGHNRQP